MQIRQCADCKKSITFNEFWRDNPSLTKHMAIEFWNNKIYSIYCPNCFYNRPERPFKVKYGYQKHSFFLDNK